MDAPNSRVLVVASPTHPTPLGQFESHVLFVNIYVFFFLYVEEAHKFKKKKKLVLHFSFFLDKIPPEMSKPFFSLFLWSQDSRISAYLLVEDVSLEASLMGGGGGGPVAATGPAGDP